jgi:hypothetical protein
MKSFNELLETFNINEKWKNGEKYRENNISLEDATKMIKKTYKIKDVEFHKGEEFGYGAEDQYHFLRKPTKTIPARVGTYFVKSKMLIVLC